MINPAKLVMRSVACASLILSAFIPAQAHEHAHESAKSATPATDAVVITTDNMTVIRDPETGVLRAPTGEELKALQVQAAKAQSLKSRVSPPPAQVFIHKSGAVGMDMPTELMSSAVAVRQADGTIVKQCLDSESSAEHIVKSATTQGSTAASKVETQ